MARGRKSAPGAVKAARGNPGRRPIAADVPAQTIGGAEAPVTLSAGARVVWNRLGEKLAGLKFLHDTDVDAFARYCWYLDRFWRTARVVDRLGDTYESESRHGKLLREHPKAKLLQRYGKALVDLEDRFGLNPRARYEILARLAGKAPTLPFEPGAKEGDAASPPPEQPSLPATGFLGRLN